jgi:anaerobic selenocysteine-containing dehydrogenase
MLDPLASKAHIWVPIRPGTDCALALAILNVIISEKLYDSEFVSEWCYGFDKLTEHARRYPPEWAGPITGISPGIIREIATMIGTIKPAFIKTGNGIGDQASDGLLLSGHQSYICITGILDIAGGIALHSGSPSLIKSPDFYPD